MKYETDARLTSALEDREEHVGQVQGKRVMRGDYLWFFVNFTFWWIYDDSFQRVFVWMHLWWHFKVIQGHFVHKKTPFIYMIELP